MAEEIIPVHLNLSYLVFTSLCLPLERLKLCLNHILLLLIDKLEFLVLNVGFEEVSKRLAVFLLQLLELLSL